MPTYIIHMGNKNKKVRGHLKEFFEKQTGKTFLVGTEWSKEIHYTDRKGIKRVDRIETPFRMDITSLKYTTHGD